MRHGLGQASVGTVYGVGIGYNVLPMAGVQHSLHVYQGEAQIQGVWPHFWPLFLGRFIHFEEGGTHKRWVHKRVGVHKRRVYVQGSRPAGQA